MTDRVRKVEDELLVTHLPAEKNMSARVDPAVAAPQSVAIDQNSLRRELAQAATEEQRRSIIESIQERFGNDVAEQIVREVRQSRGFEENEGIGEK